MEETGAAVTHLTHIWKESCWTWPCSLITFIMLSLSLSGLEATKYHDRCLPQYSRLIIDNLTHSLMELSPSWEGANCAATQKLPSVLWNPKVHCRVHKSPPLFPILSQIYSIHTLSSYLSKIHFNIVNPPTSCTSQWSSQWLSLIITQSYFIRCCKILQSDIMS
jgi:hypothetical protein